MLEKREIRCHMVWLFERIVCVRALDWVRQVVYIGVSL